MEQTFVQARVQCLEFSNGRIRVARSGQDSELRWFLAAVTVVSIVALYYLQLDWLKLISRLPDLGKTFGLLALLDFHDFGLTLEAFSQTVAITVLATIYSVLLGLVLAAFGARNLMKNKFVTYALSAFFTFLRAVPTPVWVLLALVCLGLGPAAGIVGLCVHATAFFARAFTQSFEDVPEEVIAAVLSFVLAGRLDGVREGTVVAALLVGFIARTIGRYLSFMPEKLFGIVNETEEASDAVDNEAVTTGHFCIAIGRQYGSGGRDLGAKLAEKLNCDFYDKEIIQLAAGSTGYTPEYISKREENMTNSFLYDLVHEMYAYSDEYEPPKDKIFEAEAEVIRSAAKKGNCVIVGRCADAILKDDPDCIGIFLSAPLKTRIQTVMKRDGLDEKAAKRRIEQTDRRRADNYRYYTRRIWGMSGNYQMCIDTSLGEDYVINTVLDLVKNVNRHVSESRAE